MSPPIFTPDGSEVSEIVLPDGSTASQVIGPDGNVVFEAGPDIPDESDLQAHYDATALSLSDSDSVSTWGDETDNSHDLTAVSAPTYITSGISGNPIVRFDGSNDLLDVTWPSISQPNTIFAVIQFQDTSASYGYVYDAASGDTQAMHKHTNNAEWALVAGSRETGGQVDGNPHITSALFNGSSSELRIDSSPVISGNSGSLSMDGMTVGGRGDRRDFAQVDVGEILVYPQDKTGIRSDVENYLSNKWGIAI